MTWTPVFPTGPRLISQSIVPFQQNWAFLAANIGTDHYFNTGTNTEGHHRFVQMANGGNPVIQAGMNGVSYVKVAGTAASWPFFRNADTATSVYRTVLARTDTKAIVVALNQTVIDFSVLEGTNTVIGGYVLMYDAANVNNFATMFYTWAAAGAQLQVYNVVRNGAIAAARAVGGNIIEIDATAAFTLNYQVTVCPF